MPDLPRKARKDIGQSKRGVIAGPLAAMASVPGFLTKTFEIFSSPEYADCCGWGANGDTIVIKKIEQFSKEVVPKFFKHSNFQSFVRQLNMYDFHKTVQDPSHGEFAHEFFKKGKPELLVHIKRKANKTPVATLSKPTKSSKSGAANSGGGPSTSTRSSSTASTAGAPGTGSSVKAPGGGTGTTGNSNSGISASTNLVAPVNAVAAPSSSSVSAANSYSYLSDPLYTSGGIDLDDSLGGPGGLQYFVDEGTGHPYPITSAGNGSSSGSGAGGTGSGGAYYDPYAGHPLPLLPDDIVTETDHLLMELNQQRALRESFERRMEQKLAALEGENNMLKRMFMESHHKNAVMQERMERVMKTLYNLFVGGGNAPGLALTGRMPSMLLTDIEHFSHPTLGEGAVEAGEGMGLGNREVTVLDESSSAGTGISGGGILTRSSSALGPAATRILASVPYEGGSLDRSRSSDSVAYLSRLDSATLERLPSLDLAELDTLSAVPTEPVPLNDRGDSSSASAFPSAPQRSGVGAQFAQLLRRPYAGAALSAESRGNSFDIAASSVTAPSMLRQGSFDSAYLLPMPGPAESTGPSSVSTATAAGSPSGRLFLQPGNGIAELDRSGSAYVGGGGAMAGAPLSRPPRPSSADLGPDTAVPLMRQRTFDYTPPAPGTGTDIVEEDVSGKSKRKSSGGMGAEEGHSAEQDFKRAKTESAGTDIEGELRHLQSEDVHSSLSEAQQFMDLLNRNQQTTLTRLDSLEMTIASLFDSANSTNGTQASAANTSPASAPQPSNSNDAVQGAPDASSGEGGESGSLPPAGGAAVDRAGAATKAQ